MQRDYEIDEGIFVIYNTLLALKGRYLFMPDDVKKETEKYLDYLRNILVKDYEPELDIIDGALIDRVIYDEETIEK